MKFFVSGKVGQAKNAISVIKRLREAGHEITFDWTTIDHLKPYSENRIASRRLAIKECDGVKNSDVLVVIVHKKGIGMFVELGIALAMGIPVRIIAEEEDQSMFFYHPLVKKVKNIEQVISEFD